MLNDKRAGMPISTERPIPRIVAGTDLMAALRQSIEAEVKQTLPKPAVAAKPAGLPTRTNARCYCRSKQEQSLARGKRRDSQVREFKDIGRYLRQRDIVPVGR